MAKERIDKVLSHHGFGSRKDVKAMLRRERVLVNGNVVYDPGFQVDIGADDVRVDGECVALAHDVYIMLNKCADVVCANRDGEHRTVFDLLDDSLRHTFLGGDLHCMGRLDIDTEGLLILTTDGKLTHTLMSPKTHVPKTYAVRLARAVDAQLRQAYVEKFARGFWVDREGNEAGFDCQPATLVWDSDAGASSVPLALWDGFDCLLTIFEGKFHQVKRMFSQVGNEVSYLKRVAMGRLFLDPRLKPGEYRGLSAEERELLQSHGRRSE
ncbi:MAG: rRNA pseudouridine synthase [Treponema sp.]|nr:rRNA pseudouridine synthase [Treponema sp.]